jgi:ABC-type Fe3+-hydroxamate transport system substrate-binding protein
VTRRSIIILAASAAAAAATITLLLSRGGDDAPDAQQSTRTEHGWRTRRPGPSGQPPLPPATVPTHPRVAALAPGISQILRDLGVGDLIVARHAFDKWTDQSILACGDQQGVDYEKLIAANPTHVFVQWGTNDVPERLISLARERGWVVQNIPLLSLDDIGHATVQLGSTVVTPELNALRAEDAALKPPAAPSEKQVAREKRLQAAPYVLMERLDKAYASNSTLAGVGKVLLLYQGAGETGSAAKPAALGPGSYSHDILLRIGGRSATATGKPFMPLDAEDVATLRPDAIVIVRPREPGAAHATPSADELLKSLGSIAALDVPAVKNRHVALIDDPMALVPGTNLGAFADALREILSSWVEVEMR